MIIAVISENDCIYHHFGKCSEITLYDVQHELVINKTKYKIEKRGYNNISSFLKEHNTAVVLCGGINAEAKNVLRGNRMEIIPGLSGNCDEIVVDYLSGLNIGNPDFICSSFCTNKSCTLCR